MYKISTSIYAHAHAYIHMLIWLLEQKALFKVKPQSKLADNSKPAISCCTHFLDVFCLFSIYFPVMVYKLFGFRDFFSMLLFIVKS